MLLSDFVFALFAATIFSVVLAYFLGWRHPARRASGVRGSLAFVFFTIFLAALVGGAWIRPVGPRLWGAAWLPYLGIALIVGLIILAVGAPEGRAEPARTGGETTAVFGAFFWLMVLGFLTAFVIGALL